jgi:hypothetical protein
VLPDGWRDRLVRYESPATAGVVAWCLEINDLWGDVDFTTLQRRIDHIPNLTDDQRARLRRFVERAASTDR